MNEPFNAHAEAVDLEALLAGLENLVWQSQNTAHDSTRERAEAAALVLTEHVRERVQLLADKLEELDARNFSTQ